MERTCVLLVEDDPNHQRWLERALKRTVPEILIVPTAKCPSLASLVEERRDATPECIILDLNMRDLQNSQFLRTISSLARKYPLVMISSSEDQRVVIESLRHGGRDFVPMPEALQGRPLWESIQRAMARHREQTAEKRKIERRVHRLARLAQTDPLTGLPNRQQMSQLLGERRHMVDRRGSTTVIMFDIDHFKRLNDTHGHTCGDRILCAVADVLGRSIENQQKVCRWGGEEFLVVLPQTTRGQGMLWAARICKRVAALRMETDGEQLRVTVSAGLATAPSSEADQRLVDEADQALYLAKSSGRNRFCTWEQVCIERHLDELAREAQMPPPVRYHALLRCASTLTGPVQKRHLTGHAELVGEIARQMGRSLRLEPDALRRLHWAGLCHDVGKLLIPEDILGRPGPLDQAERNLVFEHAEQGAQMANRLGFDREIADYIRYHHTWYDGSRGGADYRGNRIPLGGRILAVAEAWATMRYERCYRSPKSARQAWAELDRYRSRQFDPILVDVMK